MFLAESVLVLLSCEGPVRPLNSLSSKSLTLCSLTGRAEHQASVLHLPLADLAVISGVPPARRHPDLGHPVFRPGPLPLLDPGLLCHADVSVSLTLSFMPLTLCLCVCVCDHGLFVCSQTDQREPPGRRLHSQHEITTGEAC